MCEQSLSSKIKRTIQFYQFILNPIVHENRIWYISLCIWNNKTATVNGGAAAAAAVEIRYCTIFKIRSRFFVVVSVSVVVYKKAICIGICAQISFNSQLHILYVYQNTNTHTHIHVHWWFIYIAIFFFSACILNQFVCIGR